MGRPGKKEREIAASREVAGRHWQVARSLAHDLMEGELPDTGKVWGVVLEDAVAVYPEPAVWSLVMDFPDGSPVRLGGMGSPIACVAAVWAVHGADGLRDHPGLEPLRNRIP